MNSQTSRPEGRLAPRLYLAKPATSDAGTVGQLAELLTKVDVAAVLLRMPAAEPRVLLDRIKAFAPLVQNTGAALLIDGHADLVARGGADGAHLSGIGALAGALASLKPQRIAGVSGLSSRHDAMSAGEAGADYVMFGEPDAHGERPSIEAIADRVAWWAEVFEIPCVAYATNLDECAEFAAAGADFVLVEDLVWNDVRGAGPALMDAAAAIGQSRNSARPKAEADMNPAGLATRSALLVAIASMLAGSAVAQISLTPPSQKGAAPKSASKAPPKAAAKPAPKSAPKAPAATVAKKPPPKPAPAPVAPPPTAPDPNIDLVFGAYQRGAYRTAFDLATKRATEANDPKAMTMLGELYANGLAVKRDYGKAIDWYTRATDLGDREAMFSLAMLRLSGRGGAPNRDEGAKWLAASAKLGSPKAAYNLALLYLDGQTFPQDVKRAAELLRVAADAGNPEAQYALATFYKEGTGVEKDIEKSVRLLQAASLADNVDAEVEYAIALYNGTGTPKNEAAAVSLLRKASRQNSPIAQNRLARVLVTGQGAPMDKIEGLKWHIVAKTVGKGDLMLDEALAKLSPDERKAAEAAARKWLGAP